MSQPKVVANELQGALGAQGALDPYLVFVGPASAGPIALPAAFGRTKDLIASFGSGPTVQAAGYYISTYKRPAIMVRTTATVAASGTAVTTTGTGSTVVTAQAASSADDDYELFVKIVNGGTIGVTGITYQESRDGGRTLGPVKALGTAVTLLVASAGGAGFAMTAASTVAGDTWSYRTSAPCWNSTDLGVALTALSLTTYSWEMAVICGPVDAAAFAVLGTSFAGMPEKAWLANTRMPLIGESEATYLTSLTGVFSALSTTVGCLCAGAAKTTSGIDFLQYKRPIVHSVGALAATLSEEIDLAQVDTGNLPGVRIRDANGNPDEHDESANPGLDDARFLALRTVDGEQGIFVNNPRIFSASGSDFEFLQHRRVMIIMKRAVRLYFQKVLSKPIVVSASTGFILESEAKSIEQGIDAILRSLLLAKPKASGGAFGQFKFVHINRTDNLLSTKTMNVQAGLIPLAYPKTIVIDEGFYNPALQIIQK